MPTVGVLALQGDVREHLRILSSVGVDGVPVKTVEELGSVDGMILPGGESTTIGRLATRFGLFEPLQQRISDGLPAFGTCAGMIMLAADVTEGHQPQLGCLDIVVRRNAFGRQNDSFETDLPVEGLEDPFPAVFIRAPWVEKAGATVEILASVDDHPVLVQQDKLMAGSFHPELTDDTRLHRMFVDLIDS